MCLLPLWALVAGDALPTCSAEDTDPPEAWAPLVEAQEPAALSFCAERLLPGVELRLPVCLLPFLRGGSCPGAGHFGQMYCI